MKQKALDTARRRYKAASEAMIVSVAKAFPPGTSIVYSHADRIVPGGNIEQLSFKGAVIHVFYDGRVQIVNSKTGKNRIVDGTDTRLRLAEDAQ